MNLRTLVHGALLLVGLAQAAHAADVNVLSAGAVEPGLRPALAAFEQASGHRVVLSFASAPQIRERVGAGARFDVVIAPPAVLDDLARRGLLTDERVSLGRVGIGVAVRADAPMPDIANADALRRSLLEADVVVYNRASTGLYFEELLKRLGVESQVQGKSSRHPDGAAVMQRLLEGRGREFGVGAITEIQLFRDKGLRFVGPLPPDLQNYTTYTATAMAAPAGTPVPAEALLLLQHLRGEGSAAQFKAAGISPAPP